jgi:adenylate kinase family enzyme
MDSVAAYVLTARTNLFRQIGRFPTEPDTMASAFFDRVDPDQRTASRVSMPQTFSVKGTSGSGKSTFAAELARRLDLTYVELDALFWDPNWSEPDTEKFRARVREAIAAAPEGWVIDGNYDSRLGETVVGVAGTIVWLDLPLHVKLRRLCRRTIQRVRDDVELWNGNRETWRNVFFSRDSLFIWMIQTHYRHRREWPERFDADPRFVRLRSAREASAWLEEQTSGDTLTGP